jgi:phosphate transport system permease protein
MRDNTLLYLFRSASGWERRQTLKPFEDLNSTIATMDFLYGDVSLVLGDTTGSVRILSLNVPTGGDRRLFTETQRLKPFETPVRYFVASRRNKSFVVASEKQCALCYATTGSVRAVLDLPYDIRTLCLDAKAEHLGVVDSSGTLHLSTVHDPHPEAGWRTFFGKIWYEGYSEP